MKVRRFPIRKNVWQEKLRKYRHDIGSIRGGERQEEMDGENNHDKIYFETWKAMLQFVK